MKRWQLRRRLDALTLSTDKAYTAAVCSLRYALGRQSYITGDVADLVKYLARRFDAGHLDVLIRDIVEHGDYFERRGKPRLEAYGDECDQRIWMGLLHWLRAERSARASENSSSQGGVS